MIHLFLDDPTEDPPAHSLALDERDEHLCTTCMRPVEGPHKTCARCDDLEERIYERLQDRSGE